MRARLLEDGLELLGRVPDFGRVEADPVDHPPVAQRLVERLHRRVGAEVAEETHDQLRREAELLLAVSRRVVNTVEGRLEGDAAGGVGLRVEEDLGVAHVLRGAALEVVPRQVIEVFVA